MTDLTPFITALEAAQKKEKYTAEVQAAAAGIDVATLKAAVEAALAMGETDKLDDEAQVAALAAGLEFAAKVVMMLQTAPGPFEKKDLWVYFKIGKGVVPEKPGMFDMVVCLPLLWFFQLLIRRLLVLLGMVLTLSCVVEEAAVWCLGGC